MLSRYQSRGVLRLPTRAFGAADCVAAEGACVVADCDAIDRGCEDGVGEDGVCDGDFWAEVLAVVDTLGAVSWGAFDRGGSEGRGNERRGSAGGRKARRFVVVVTSATVVSGAGGVVSSDVVAGIDDVVGGVLVLVAGRVLVAAGRVVVVVVVVVGRFVVVVARMVVEVVDRGMVARLAGTVTVIVARGTSVESATGPVAALVGGGGATTGAVVGTVVDEGARVVAAAVVGDAVVGGVVGGSSTRNRSCPLKLVSSTPNASQTMS